MARGRTVRTLKKEAQFLEVLRATANVTKAAGAIQITRRTAHDWRTQNEAFAKAWDDAIEEALDSAEGELYRRAVDGTSKPVYYQGVQCGEIQEFSDTLLIFLLKSRRPKIYREHVDIKHQFSNLSDADLIARAAGLFGGNSKQGVGAAEGDSSGQS